MRLPRFMFPATVWLCAAGLAMSANAQPPDAPRTLTLADALRLASERNLALRAAREETAIARGSVLETRAVALPHIDLGAQYVRLDEVPTLGGMPLGKLDQYELTADVSQVIYAGGSVRAALRLANEYTGAAEAQSAYAGEQTAFAIHALFNQVLLTQQTLGVADQQVELARRNHADVSARLNQGMARRFDLLRADEQVSSAEAQHLATANAVRKAHLALLHALELPLSDECRIAGSLQAGISVDGADDLDEALLRRHDVVAAERAVAIQREALAIARGGRFPTVALFGQAKRANPSRAFEDEWENSWLAGLRADVPLFDGLETRGKVAQAKARLRRARFQRDDAVSRARLEIAEAQADLATAAMVVDARERNVTQAQEALRLAQRAYAEGMGQQIDVIGAQTAFSGSRYQLASARFNHTMARRRLQLVTGNLTFASASVDANASDIQETSE